MSIIQPNQQIVAIFVYNFVGVISFTVDGIIFAIIGIIVDLDEDNLDTDSDFDSVVGQYSSLIICPACSKLINCVNIRVTSHFSW